MCKCKCVSLFVCVSLCVFLSLSLTLSRSLSPTRFPNLSFLPYSTSFPLLLSLTHSFPPSHPPSLSPLTVPLTRLHPLDLPHLSLLLADHPHFLRPNRGAQSCASRYGHLGGLVERNRHSACSGECQRPREFVQASLVVSLQGGRQRSISASRPCAE